MTIGSAFFYLAGCNKDTNQKVDPTPNPGGDGGHQIEEVQTTVGAIVKEYIQNNNLSGLIQNEHLECVQEIVGSAVKNLDLNTFKTTYKDGEAVAVYKYKNANGQTQLGSTHFDVSMFVQNYLSFDLEDLLLMELKELGDTSVSESLLDKYETRLATAMDKILNDINTNQYQTVQRNEYAIDCGISDSLKADVLKAIERQNAKNKLAEPVTFGAPREDGTVIITGVDSQGKVCECYFKIEAGKDMTASEYYQQVASGTWDAFTTKRIATDAPYSQPAVEEQKQMVSVSSIFDEVFADFKLADLKELMNGIAKERLPYGESKILFAEFNEDKTEVALYTEYTNNLNKTGLLTITCTGDVVKDLWDYQSVKDVSELKTEFLGKYGEQVEQDLLSQIKQELTSEREKYEISEKHIQDFDGSKLKYDTLCGGTITPLEDINKYGEKLLEKEQNAQVLATYITSWSGRRLDADNKFNTGYYQSSDVCVVYKNDEIISIYKANIIVPHYNDSTNESLYQSILEGKYIFQGEETTEIDMKNTLSFMEEGKTAEEKHEYIFESPVDIFFEDNRR